MNSSSPDQRKRFRKFYLFSLGIWVLSILSYFIIQLFVLPWITDAQHYTMWVGLASLIRMVGIFTVPAIVMVSFPLRLAERWMDKIAERNQKKKDP